MASALEGRIQPDPHDLERQVRVDEPGTEREAIRVIVLAPQAGALHVPAQGHAHARHAVRHDGLPVPRAAEDDAALAFALAHCFRSRPAVVGIVAALGGEATEVNYLVPQLLQQGLDALFEVKAGVVRSNGNAHGL